MLANHTLSGGLVQTRQSDSVFEAGIAGWIALSRSEFFGMLVGASSACHSGLARGGMFLRQ
jgi:hypothetical protein